MTEHEMMKLFVINFRKLLIKKDMTQLKLANLSGTSQQQINCYANGHTIPGLLTAKRLATALGCSLDDFFRED